MFQWLMRFLARFKDEQERDKLKSVRFSPCAAQYCGHSFEAHQMGSQGNCRWCRCPGWVPEEKAYLFKPCIEVGCGHSLEDHAGSAEGLCQRCKCLGWTDK